MLLIPAIDLKDGHCVRLRQGMMDDETVFSDDPVMTAGRWVGEGARRLHIVDLNGAFAGEPVNGEEIRKIVSEYPDLTVQVGGGIRTLETIKNYLELGVNYVIIGTQAVRDPGFVHNACERFPGHIIVGLDGKEGMVAINGWSKLTEYSVTEMAKVFEQDGVAAIIYTDISRDGMLTRPDIEATAALAAALKTPIIASGGISGIDDIRELCKLEPAGVVGAITGRAIYEGTLDFARGQQLADSLSK